MISDQKPVRITWLDITSQTDPWIDIDDAMEMKPAIMISVGWIVKENIDFVTLASTVDTEEELVGDVNCIPRPTIMNIEPLETSKSK